MREQRESPPPGQGERRKEKTRQEIVRVAMDLFRTQGFDTTAMEQIAEAADIGKGTLYNHYPAKDAISGAHMQGTVRELEPEMDRLLVEHQEVRSVMRAMAREHLSVEKWLFELE